MSRARGFRTFIAAGGDSQGEGCCRRNSATIGDGIAGLVTLTNMTHPAIPLRVAQCLPDVKLCVSTNGLALPRAVDSLVELGVDHVTITMNAIDAHVGADIYDWVYFDGQRLRGQGGGPGVDRSTDGGDVSP